MQNWVRFFNQIILFFSKNLSCIYVSIFWDWQSDPESTGEESLTIFLDKQKLNKKSEGNSNSSVVSLELLHQLAASYFTDRESTLRRLHHLQIATSAIKVVHTSIKHLCKSPVYWLHVGPNLWGPQTATHQGETRKHKTVPSGCIEARCSHNKSFCWLSSYRRKQSFLKVRDDRACKDIFFMTAWI